MDFYDEELYEDDTVEYAIGRKQVRRSRRLNNFIFEKRFYGIKKDNLPKWKRSRRGKRKDYNITNTDDMSDASLIYWESCDYTNSTIQTGKEYIQWLIDNDIPFIIRRERR